MDYPGSNDETTLQGNTKQAYAKKVSKAVPKTGCSCNLKKLLKKVRSK